MKTKKIAFVSATALTAGLAHGQVVTNSQIIYTYANVPVGTTLAAGYSFDLNHDGYPDFQLHFNSSSASKPYLDTSEYEGQPNFTPSVLADSNGDGLPVATNGTPIDSSWESPEEYGYFYQDGSANVQGDWDSNGANIQGYVGLTLVDGDGNNYYGWAQFVYNSATVFDGAAGEITLIDYAIDQNPGETILAGQQAPPDTGPQILVTPVSQTNGVMTTVQFTVIATGNPYPTYQWLAETNGNNTYTPLADGGPIVGSQSNVLTISNVVPGFSGNYEVQLQNGYGSANATAALSVAPLTITGLTPSPVAVFPGANLSLYPSYSSGTPILSYQWLKDGAILNSSGRISGTTSSNLVITALATSDSANYSVILSNMYGSETSAVDVVSVAPPATPYEQEVYLTYPQNYYAFNETNINPASGAAVALDYANAANGAYGNGTENGFPAFAVAGPNPAAGFSGFSTTNSALAIVNSAQLYSSGVTIPPLNLNGNAVTFTMWINPQESEPDYAVLNTYRSSTAGTANGMNYSPNGYLGFHWNDQLYSWDWDSDLSPPTGQWSFVALAVSPTSTIEYLFDSSGMTTATNDNANVVQALNTPGYIGVDENDPNFIGDIDEVATFDQTLSQTELTNLWNAAVTGVVTPQAATLHIIQSGANVMISWNPPFGTLQQASSLSGPWTTISAATSPYTTVIGPSLFYRVISQ